ncbi:MAG: hypothetical protein HQK76_14645 [Desulfobacterales bacterium]|nr:hypothetical protein [Desulfobacterales bacterium]
MIDMFNKMGENILLLDNGNVFSKFYPSEDNVKLIFDSMGLMDYSCMNLSPTEFNMGLDTLIELLHPVSFPIITSNLVYKENNRPFKEKYAIKKIGNINIGIVGILPEELTELISDKMLKETLIALPPEKEVEKILSEIRSKVDIVILLSQCSYDKTVSLINNLKGVDIVVSNQKTWSTCTKTNDETNLFQLNPGGGYIDFIKIFKDKNGNIFVTDKKLILLDDKVPNNEKVLKMIGDEKVSETLKEQDKLSKELNKQLQLTPEEFMKLMLEQQKQKGENK